MIDLEGLEEHRRANKNLVKLVTGQLKTFFGRLDLSKPYDARDALLEFTPALVQSVAPVGEQLALEWYERMMLVGGAAKATGYVVQTPPELDLAEAVTGSVKYAAGHLFSANPAEALKPLSVAVNKHTRAPGREAIIWNAVAEGARWARVPQGEVTCSFCMVMASRGAVYLNDQTAGSDDYGDDNKFHGGCDCEIMRFGKGDDYPANYLPEDYEFMYRKSAEYAGTNDLQGLLHDFRRRFPEFVTDAVYDDEYLSMMG